MKKSIVTMLVFSGLVCLCSPLYSQKYIADHTVANETVLRSIPEEYINKVKTDFVLAYPHTSHGTHVSRGMFGLQGYKEGDAGLYGISATPSDTKLEFRDRAMLDYAPAGVERLDLTTGLEFFVQVTRDYLDAPENASVNVVMWAWSRISDLDAEGIYLPGMDSLINEYGPGGSRIGSGAGQREVPVHFIYMTGHAEKNNNTGPLKPREQSILITNYCKANGRFCLDYYPIDTRTMEGTYYEDTGDNGDSDIYGGNFLEDWQNSHTLGVHWYENWQTPEGIVDLGEHTTQHITSNRKAYAMWWILARLAGWDGGSSSTGPEGQQDDFRMYPNPGNDIVYIETPNLHITDIKVMNSLGQVVKEQRPPETSVSNFELELGGIQPGVYIVKLTDSQQQVYASTLVINN
jgi:hypothetical protein